MELVREDASGQVDEVASHPVPYDEHLLDRARTQWQFGDWESLARMTRETLQHHPDRAKLALLAAAGHQQSNDTAATRSYARLALEWGCGKKLVSQILIAGAYNYLGRAATIAGQSARAVKHYQSAVGIGTPGADIRLMVQARSDSQTELLAASCETQTRCVLFPRLPPVEGSLPAPTPAEATQDGLIEELVHLCVRSGDVHAEVDAQMACGALSGSEAFRFFIGLSDHFRSEKDTLTALHFLNQARNFASFVDQSGAQSVAQRLVALGKADEALDSLVESALGSNGWGDKERGALLGAYEKTRSAAKAKGEHGHEVLLAYLKANGQLTKRNALGLPRVMIEIGSTREDVPGQGSTRKLAEYCGSSDIQFITVDMDPHNTESAARLFQGLKLRFEAVNQKGEDFLRAYNGAIDFVFLDAYDFDHGKHSALRQSRYERFLGERINDAECHRMHLDCARSVAEKLSIDGLVCVDDTWQEDGKWTAKGTLAMPYLLEHGFVVVDARNRAALLRRK